MSHFTDLANDQLRQLIDAQQLFSAYRAERAKLARDYAGMMRWKSAGGAEYLTHKISGSERSLGRRSAETETQFASFNEGRASTRSRKATMLVRLKAMDRINVAHKLGRIPDLPARIIDALDRAGLMGRDVRVVGTSALFAYEARAGIRFESGLVATQDFDVMLDAANELNLDAAANVRSAVFAALLEADRSFVAQYGELAVNAEGFIVDFLASDAGCAAPVAGPLFTEIAVGHTGRPVFMAVPEPKAFVAHKRWLAREASRKPLKRKRDATQADAVEAALPQLA